MIYHKLLKLSRKFKSRFFLFEELSRLDSKAKIDSKLFSALYWKAFRSPSVAEDWIPLHRFIGHLGPLILVDIGQILETLLLNIMPTFQSTMFTVLNQFRQLMPSFNNVLRIALSGLLLSTWP
jgi:hypothetical protein